MSISIGSPSFAKFAKATATTVYLMTAVKAAVRPAFNLADKKSDKDSRKYSAVNEFLYQVVCIAFAAGLMPLAERHGLKLAEKSLVKISALSKNITKIGDYEEFKPLAELKGFKKLKAFKKLYVEKSFDEQYISKLNNAKAKSASELNDTEKEILAADKAMHHVYGGVEAGSFIASIVGLTILAPKVGHEILHPIMHALKMDKKDKNIGQPSEIFLADAKNPTEKAGKLNAKA